MGVSGRCYVWLHGEPVDPSRVEIIRNMTNTAVLIDGIEVTDCTVEFDYDGRPILVASV